MQNAKEVEKHKQMAQSSWRASWVACARLWRGARFRACRPSEREDLHNNARGPAQRTPSVSSLSCSSFTSLAPAFSTVVGCLSAFGSELMVTGLDDWSVPRGLPGALRPKMVEENMFGSSKTTPLVSACTAHSTVARGIRGQKSASLRVCVCVRARAHTHTPTHSTHTHTRCAAPGSALTTRIDIS